MKLIGLIVWLRVLHLSSIEVSFGCVCGSLKLIYGGHIDDDTR